MAFDGNGNWISDFSAVADRDADIKILASRFDGIFIADIATSFENCLTKDGQVKTQTNFNLNNYRAINVADPVNDKDAVNKETLDNMLDTLYPIGAVYIGTQASCPLETLISGSTWELVAQDKALWTGDGTNGNTTINAGLPNITGSTVVSDDAGKSGGTTGAFSVDGRFGNEDGNGEEPTYKVSLDASRCSSIYGASSTVQPPAYVVNVWRRTA